MHLLGEDQQKKSSLSLHLMCFDSKPDSLGKQTNIQEYIICLTHLAELLPTSSRFKWVMHCSIHKRFPWVGWNMPRSFCCSSVFCPEWCQVFSLLPPDPVSKADPCASPCGHYSQTWTAAHLGNTRAHVQTRTSMHTHSRTRAVWAALCRMQPDRKGSGFSGHIEERKHQLMCTVEEDITSNLKLLECWYSPFNSLKKQLSLPTGFGFPGDLVVDKSTAAECEKAKVVPCSHTYLSCPPLKLKPD